MKILDKGKGCELLTKKTFEAIKDETLATIFIMAQQNSMKFACQLTFKQNLYVHFYKYYITLTSMFLEHSLLRPSCYLGAMRSLMLTFTSLLPYLYDRAAHSRLPDSLRT